MLVKPRNTISVMKFAINEIILFFKIIRLQKNSKLLNGFYTIPLRLQVVNNPMNVIHLLRNVICTLPLLLLLSCKDNNGKNNTIKLLNEENFTTEATHFINVQCGAASIPLRNRLLSQKELMFSQENTEAAKALNATTIIEYLENGDRVKLLNIDSSGYYYVEVIGQLLSSRGFRTDSKIGEIKRGYIIAKFCGKPTIKELLKVQVSPKKINDDDKGVLDAIEVFTKNNETLKYVFAHVGEESSFYQLLSFDITSFSDIYYKVNIIELQERQMHFDGVATLHDKYRFSNGKEFLRYLCEDICGHEMELHISSNYEEAFILMKGDYNLNSSLSILSVPKVNIDSFKNDVIMERIR